jgi:hypothetical protein
MLGQIGSLKQTPRPALLGLLVAVLALNAIGCAQIFGLFRPLDGERKVEVEGRYKKLDNQHVAVMVAASDKILVNYPRARPALTRSISQALAKNVKGISLMNPDEVIRYQQENQYWHTLPYGQLIDRMDVDVLVLVDLVEYQTHEPGNRHEFRGVINANVNVIDADAQDSDKLVFNTQVGVQYPRNSQIPLINRDQETVESKTVKRFTRRAAGLFYDHTRSVSRD